MIFDSKPKSQPISKRQVWEAWKKVKSKGDSPGIDGVTKEMVKSNPEKYLYPVWNRLASGSYFPPPVKQEHILKYDGSERELGIPTVCDRVAQMVIKEELEAEVDKYFSANSYAYRPNKSAHQAIEQAKKNCWNYAWVIDMDIKGFFDNIDHQLMLRALKHFTNKKHIILYVKRWLKAPVQLKDGKLVEDNAKGIPQGGVISPILANIFLHFAFDKWIEENYPDCPYERYADDIIVHVQNEPKAKKLLKLIGERMRRCKLELHPLKTKIVYCNRKTRRMRKRKPKCVKFDFLGFTFQPRRIRTRDGKFILGFSPAISMGSKKRIWEICRKLKFHRWVSVTLTKLANELKAKLQGWINYYGKFRISALHSVFREINNRLLKWVRNKYKRFRKKSRKHARIWLRNVAKHYPTLFAHWKYGFLP